MNLTNRKSIGNINPATVNSVAEISTSNSTGVLSTPFCKCFFYVRNLWWAVWSIFGWRFPVDRSTNSVQPATLKISTFGGSYLTTTGDNHV